VFSEQQVVGWGLDEFGVMAEKLKVVQMQVVSKDTCNKSDINFFPYFAHDTTFCAGSKNKGIFMFSQ
jgi:hypothetical protein